MFRPEDPDLALTYQATVLVSVGHVKIALVQLSDTTGYYCTGHYY